MRGLLTEHFPSTAFASLAADIVTQTLNFGLPSPIDVQVSGINTDANRVIANELLQKMRAIPGAVDLRVQQAYDYPTLNVDVGRTKARQLGLTQQNVASNILVSLSGSFPAKTSATATTVFVYDEAGICWGSMMALETSLKRPFGWVTCRWPRCSQAGPEYDDQAFFNYRNDRHSVLVAQAYRSVHLPIYRHTYELDLVRSQVLINIHNMGVNNLRTRRPPLSTTFL